MDVVALQEAEGTFVCSEVRQKLLFSSLVPSQPTRKPFHSATLLRLNVHGRGELLAMFTLLLGDLTSTRVFLRLDELLPQRLQQQQQERQKCGARSITFQQSQ